MRIPSGRVTFLFKIDAVDTRTTPDGVSIIKMSFTTSDKKTRVARFSVRRLADGFAAVAVSHIEAEATSREGTSTDVRMVVGNTYRVVVDYDLRAPAAGKPMVEVTVDGRKAATVDGENEGIRQLDPEVRIFFGVASENLGMTAFFDDFVLTGDVVR